MLRFKRESILSMKYEIYKYFSPFNELGKYIKTQCILENY